MQSQGKAGKDLNIKQHDHEAKLQLATAGRQILYQQILRPQALLPKHGWKPQEVLLQNLPSRLWPAAFCLPWSSCVM